MTMPFTKMVASGNDFIVLDNRGKEFDRGDSSRIRRLCTRRMSIGADGLILLEDAPNHDFAMAYFNSDGFEVSMCGNGGRCIALFAHLLGIVDRDMTFIAPAGTYRATIESLEGESADVTLSMPDPADIHPREEIRIDDESLTIGTIDTGVPHAVLRVDDLSKVDVRATGSRIRHHARFERHGTNVDFIEIGERGVVGVRTYERGVEDETLSCGTGAVASAIMASIWADLPGPVILKPVSGEELSVSFERTGENFSRIALQGEARVVYRGILSSL